MEEGLWKVTRNSGAWGDMLDFYWDHGAYLPTTESKNTLGRLTFPEITLDSGYCRQSRLTMNKVAQGALVVGWILPPLCYIVKHQTPGLSSLLSSRLIYKLRLLNSSPIPVYNPSSPLMFVSQRQPRPLARSTHVSPRLPRVGEGGPERKLCHR
jgi:hypothetical protein